MTQIVTIAAAGSSQSTATPVPATLVLVTQTTGNLGAVLPSGAVVGTVVEIHVDNSIASGLVVYPASGDSLNDSNITVGGVPAYTPNVCVTFRKISDILWGIVSTI